MRTHDDREIHLPDEDDIPTPVNSPWPFLLVTLVAPVLLLLLIAWVRA